MVHRKHELLEYNHCGNLKKCWAGFVCILLSAAAILSADSFQPVLEFGSGSAVQNDNQHR